MRFYSIELVIISLNLLQNLLQILLEDAREFYTYLL